MHKALRTTDIVEIIFSHLDAETLADCSLTCKSWNQIIIDASLWRKLAQRIKKTSKQNCSILTLKGINQTFDDLLEEKTHFKSLCLRLNHFNKHWQAIEPVETFLKCSPAEVILMSGQRSVLTLVKLQVNKNYHFSWEPWWWWKDKRGWIAAFAVDGDFLLCGVIETLQVAPNHLFIQLKSISYS